MRPSAHLLALALPLWLLGGCASAPLRNGIPNLACVDPSANIWRGGQPTAEGWTWLKEHGVTNVVKLNTGHDPAEDASGLTIRRFPISTGEQLFGVPEGLVSNAVTAITPGTLVHCGSSARTTNWWAGVTNSRGGQDRTGLVCAEYRVRVQHWPRADAQVEMLRMGFHPTLKGLWDFWDEYAK